MTSEDMKMEYELFKDRPASNEGRLEKEIRCYDLLDSIGVEYWRTDHPDAEAYTMEACREISRSKRRNLLPSWDVPDFPLPAVRRWRRCSDAVRFFQHHGFDE